VEAARNRAIARNAILRIEVHFLKWGEQYMEVVEALRWGIENGKSERQKSKVKSQKSGDIGREQKAAPATARKESGQSVTLEIVEVQVEGKTKPHA
jgi:hypothetical protein